MNEQQATQDHHGHERDPAQQGVAALGSDDGDTRPGRDGVAVGLLVVVAGALGVMAAVGELMLPVLVFTVVFAALAAWSALSSSRVSRWVITSLLVVFLAMNVPFAIGDLSHPESAPAFVPTLLVIGGGLITVVLAVVAALGRRAHAGRVWGAGALVFVVMVAGSLVAAARVDDAVIEPGDTAVQAVDYEYPERVEVRSGAGVFVDNEDAARHTFVIEDDSARVLEVPAGSTARLDIDVPPGSYRFYCDIAGHEDMAGTLEVT
jgi:plastocyanin